MLQVSAFFADKMRDFVTVKKNVSKSVRDRFEIVDLGFNLLAENMEGFVQAITLKTDDATRRTARDG